MSSIFLTFLEYTVENDIIFQFVFDAKNSQLFVYIVCFSFFRCEHDFELKMFKWKVSGLGGGSSKKANKGQQNNDKLNNANIAQTSASPGGGENNNENNDQNMKNNKNNKEARSPSKK